MTTPPTGTQTERPGTPADGPPASPIAGVVARPSLDGESRAWRNTPAPTVFQQRAERALAVAELHRTEALLQQARQEIDAVAHSLSHDVRAPIRHIDGFVEMLKELEGAALSAEGQHLLERFRASADRLGSLIDDLVRFSQVGRGDFQPIRVDHEALVRAVWNELLPAQTDAAPLLELNPLPASYADPLLLRQLWLSLLDNAVKFSRARRPARVTVDAHHEDGRTWYRVADNGAGFDQQYAHNMFKIFKRLHRTGEFPGNGIGLAIAKKIVSLHGGRICSSGRPDGGATFEFTLETYAPLSA